jgi:hypothetical protein
MKGSFRELVPGIDVCLFDVDEVRDDIHRPVLGSDVEGGLAIAVKTMLVDSLAGETANVGGVISVRRVVDRKKVALIGDCPSH